MIPPSRDASRGRRPQKIVAGSSNRQACGSFLVLLGSNRDKANIVIDPKQARYNGLAQT